METVSFIPVYQAMNLRVEITKRIFNLDGFYVISNKTTKSL